MRVKAIGLIYLVTGESKAAELSISCCCSIIARFQFTRNDKNLLIQNQSQQSSSRKGSGSFSG